MIMKGKWLKGYVDPTCYKSTSDFEYWVNVEVIHCRDVAVQRLYINVTVYFHKRRCSATSLRNHYQILILSFSSLYILSPGFTLKAL